MRSDMFKIIVERPRLGVRHALSPKLKRTRDYTLKHIGLKRHAIESGWYGKCFNENLSPLVRFLRTRIGRRWDDVFSEICAQLDTGSTVKMHLRQHIDDFVLRRISIGRHGEWLCEDEVLGRSDIIYKWRRLFVDPEDGILKDTAALADRLPAANRATKGGAHG